MEGVAPTDCGRLARSLWLSAFGEDDDRLKKAEKLYLRAIKNRSDLSKELYEDAVEKMCLIYVQSGRASRVSRVLASLGYVCRLSTDVLDYDYPMATGSIERDNSCPCVTIDNFLTPGDLLHLCSVFGREDDFWSHHGYSVEPPSPYFSYVIPTRDRENLDSKFGILGQILLNITSNTTLKEKFPQLLHTNFAEMWAHNRPHASGHQLHFDSDDEGRSKMGEDGVPRHPVMSVVLYLSGAGCGGPSLVTTQKLCDRSLSSEGWLSAPVDGRLTAFDGRVLHGVVPGKGNGPAPARHRVTLMFAFWEDIEIRGGDSYADERNCASARAFPNVDDNVEWARRLRSTCHGNKRDCVNMKREVHPIPIKSVFQTLDGESWTKEMGFPDYSQIYQGF
mmetsp:Transcript_32553/g.64550  ORF Transcript_32553/g.64550 Transcript_32553/m.64550 type:complete len:392 (+) Transcript_32553:147-1322(+)